MKKVNVILRKQEVIFVIWDGKDETFDLLSEVMLPKLNIHGERFKFKKIDEFDGDIIFAVSETDYRSITSSSFYRIGEYIVLDYSPLCQYGYPIEPNERVYIIKGLEEDVFRKYYIL